LRTRSTQAAPAGVFDAASADRAVAFFRRFIRHTKGEWAGKPFELLPWQEDEVIRPVFGRKNSDGTRQIRTAFVHVPRKNGKSELIAGVGLYMLLADGELGAEVYLCAADRDQAAIVFEMASAMIAANPDLRRRCVPYKNQILVESTRSKLKVLSSEAYTKHGYSPSAVIFDELHAQPDRELWDVMQTGQGARRQPLTIAMTTAGYDRNSICYEQYDYARKVRSGVIADPEFLPVLYGADDKDDWKDEGVWKKTNPSLGRTIQIEYLRKESRKAAEMPSYENTFRRLFLNQWTQQESRWIPIDKWDACQTPLDPGQLLRRRCFGGLDMSSKIDLTSLVLVFPMDGDAFFVLPFFWIPRDRILERARRDRVPYDAWEKQGLLRVTEGDVVDYRAVERDIVQMGTEYEIVDIAFDRWGATQITQNLTDAGVSMFPFGQGFFSMSEPTKETERLILGRKLMHHGHAILRWNVDNMVVRQDPAGNQKPDKGKAREKIDGTVAMIMAFDRALRHRGGEKNASVYDGKGMAFL